MRSISNYEIDIKSAPVSEKRHKTRSLTRTIKSLERGLLPPSFDITPLVCHIAQQLLRALGQTAPLASDLVEVQRALLTPDTFNDDQLADYLLTLAASAVADPATQPSDPISPLLIPHLLRGVSTSQLDELVTRSLTLLDAYPVPEPCQFNEATAFVGFGPHVSHNVRPNPLDPIYPKLNQFQTNWRLTPTGEDPLDLLLLYGAPAAQSAKKVDKIRADVLKQANALLTPGATADSISQFMHTKVGMREATYHDYMRAVDRVFRGNWDELMIKATRESLTQDIEVVCARLIIVTLLRRSNALQRTPATLSAQWLVGMSMLSGVSLAKLAEFAKLDMQRRGECFTTPEALTQALAIVDATELGAWNRCEQYVFSVVQSLKYADPLKAAVAKRLRKSRNPLWTNDAQSYHLRESGTYIRQPEDLVAEAEDPYSRMMRTPKRGLGE